MTQYNTRDAATTAWVSQSTAAGYVVERGGGWLDTPHGRVQGLDRLADRLEAEGVLVRVPARSPSQMSGLWAWELRLD